VVVQKVVVPAPEAKEKKEKTAVEAGTSTVVVNLPADAKLYVDDVACPLTSERRTFRTPKLQPGKEYYYTLRAEVMRDGEPVVEKKKVLVAAGRRVNVDFGEMTTVSTSRRR
jgi:uncharacterized protein (TIGR03000 family)